MKKSILPIILIFIVCLAACNTAENKVLLTNELMTVQDIEELGINCFNYCGYLFFSYSGKNVVAQTDSDGKMLKKVESYDIVKPDTSDFDGLVEGMTVFEVVRRVGLPKGSYSSGMITLFFETHDGKSAYTVYLSNSDNTELTVGSIIKH